MLRFCLLLSALLVGSATSSPALGAGKKAASVTLEKNDKGVAVKIGGELFTQYLARSGSKPVLWPINGPTGQPMTRSWPIGPKEDGEHTDHVHQRSFWFTHEGVNGVNFWAEPRSYSPNDRAQHQVGLIAHREFAEMSTAGGVATLVAIADWLDPADKQLLEERTTYRFSADEAKRTIDMTVELTAKNGPVELEDRKDGLFGIRVASSIKVDAEQGGQIVNSEGQTDKGAWGQYATWVDYHGPVAGETVGVAILWHPGNFRSPIRWHVRNYGLFAANPLAENGFPEADRKQGGTTIENGETLTLRFRILFHRGDQQQAKIPEAYAAYAAE